NTTLPNNSLFLIKPDPASRYLVETDPRFASYRNWLSSDYQLTALSINPDTAQKRLGDGFYEQKLIREQVAQLTGRRFLDGYASDEAQYQALMNNSVTYAQQFDLQPGISLTPAQMAQLTSDIVWLVEETIILADGSTTSALVPRVYVRVQEGDLSGVGALISGQNIDLDLSGDLSNSGTISGRKVTALTADNVRNLGGRIQGNDVAVKARNDLDNIGGTIAATNSLTAIAGRDMNILTTTSSTSSTQGSRTNIDRVAGLYVTGGTGNLGAYAGRDLTLTAAIIANQGSGATTLAADRNLTMDTLRESNNLNLIWNRDNYHKEASSTDIGTTVQTLGDLRLFAGQDINLKAAGVTSESGALSATAGRDIILTAGEDYNRVENAYKSTSKGFMSKKTTIARDVVEYSNALGTTLSGATTQLEAGRDINVTAGNIVSDRQTDLLAGGDITIQAGEN
ncbi:hemagglutinin repeat-containing protein, partial [bacterium]|nr:hemagglutinin repeat-containing protein [bacterium]